MKMVQVGEVYENPGKHRFRIDEMLYYPDADMIFYAIEPLGDFPGHRQLATSARILKSCRLVKSKRKLKRGCLT